MLLLELRKLAMSDMRASSYHASYLASMHLNMCTGKYKILFITQTDRHGLVTQYTPLECYVHMLIVIRTLTK